MPNLIEQQDLLKGLPDARLALLLQKPTGDIPPFLVAAEAQRRQTIRQQFAGESNSASVVDTLSRQLAPQNIKAQPEMTPPVPATPQMQGVMALQQQQQMMQAAQQPGMAGGGPVRRFAGTGTGYVRPTVDTLSGSYYNDPLGTPSVAEGDTSAFGNLFSADIPRFVGDVLGQPIPQWQLDEEAKARKEREGATTSGLTQEENQQDIAALVRRATMPRTTVNDPGTKDTSVENQTKSENPSQEGTPDDFRARLAKLYANNEPSGWEKAQAWFAASEQFLDPSKTTMQSLTGAGKAFSEARGEMKAKERDNNVELQKALLNYDIQQRDYNRSANVSAVENQREAYKFYATQAQANAQAASEANKQLARELNDYIKTTYPDDGLNPTDPAKLAADPNVAEIKRQMAENQKLISGYLAQNAAALKGFGGLTGTDPSVMAWDGNGLRKVGG